MGSERVGFCTISYHSLFWKKYLQGQREIAGAWYPAFQMVPRVFPVAISDYRAWNKPWALRICQKKMKKRKIFTHLKSPKILVYLFCFVAEDNICKKSQKNFSQMPSYTFLSVWFWGHTQQCLGTTPDCMLKVSCFQSMCLNTYGICCLFFSILHLPR